MASRRRLLKGLAAGGLLALTPRPRRVMGASPVDVALFADPGLARYGFPDGHPLGLDRQGAFLREAAAQDLLARVRETGGRAATKDELTRFHTAGYVALVESAEARGLELLDGGDTPVFPGLYPASAWVVGSALAGLERVMAGDCRRSFQPIGGLHHAARGHAAGFCVFNDLGVVIETLRRVYEVRRVAYVDIDVHHGDGVFYAFEDDSELIFADIHQDARTLYPGTGRVGETGLGAAAGTKLNIELPPRAGDAEFMAVWPQVEAHLARLEPEFLLFQCGADGLAGDPLAELAYTPAVHAHATQRLRALADAHCDGRLMAFGGGGYDRANLAQAWTAVLRELAA